MGWAIGLLAATAMAGASAPAGAIILQFSATIDQAQETPPTGSPATGSGVFTMDTDANTLSFNITFSGLTSPEAAAHIHGFAPPGVPASIIFPLPLGSPKVGVWNFSESDQAGIINGLTYVNIHSGMHLGGEIRGQIVRPQVVDRFKCYKAKDLKAPKFAATSVSLSDQFGVNDGTFTAKKPALFCNPVSVGGGGILNLLDHLTCYKIKGPKLQPAQRPSVEITNDLGVTQLEVKKPALLCVPSTKTVLP